VIVVDDASPDGTQKVCTELMEIFNTNDKDHIVRAHASCSESVACLLEGC
jgi:glycosyltransferase involved in cell wall biosynthesis